MDVERLTKELVAAEARIEQLSSELSSRLLNRGPSFQEVSKSFDVSHINDKVYAKVVDDFSKFLEPEMIHLLKSVSENMRRDGRFYMDVSVAQDRSACLHEYRFRAPEMRTTVRDMML